MKSKLLGLSLALAVGLGTAGILYAGGEDSTTKKSVYKIKLQGDDVVVADVSDMALGEGRTFYTDSGKVIDVLSTEQGMEIYIDGELMTVPEIPAVPDIEHLNDIHAVAMAAAEAELSRVHDELGNVMVEFKCIKSVHEDTDGEATEEDLEDCGSHLTIDFAEDLALNIHEELELLDIENIGDQVIKIERIVETVTESLHEDGLVHPHEDHDVMIITKESYSDEDEI